EVADWPLALYPDRDVSDPHDEGERDRKRELGRRRELDQRDETEQVHDPDEEEDRDDEGQVLVALLAQLLPQNLVPDEQHAKFAEILRALGDELWLPERHKEEGQDDDRGQDREHDGLGDLDARDGEDRLEV